MSDSIKDKIAYCEELVLEGFDKDYIIKAVGIEKLSQKDAGRILKELDGLITEIELSKQNKSQYIGLMLLGAVVMLVGLMVTLRSYLSSSESYILAYGAILSGAWVLKVGYQKYNQPERTHSNRNSIFSKSKFKR